jgi:uncharacterized HAD superfamily protein
MAPVDRKRASKKPKAVVVDFDDVVVDFLRTLCMLHNKVHDTSLSAADLTSWNFQGLEFKDIQGNVVTSDDLKETMRAYESHGLYAILPVLEEAKFALELMKKLDYKIIILTARNEMFKIQTELNIMIRNIPCDELIFDSDKVERILKLKRKYDVILFADDRLDTVNEVSEKCDLAYTFLLDRAHNAGQTVGEYVTVIKDLLEVVRYLK